MTDFRRPVLVLAGCGRMGHALLAGWNRHHLDLDIVILDPAPRDAGLGVRVFAQPSDLIDAGIVPDLLVLAIKPQIFHTIRQDLGSLIGPDTLVISIMAGITLTELASLAPDAACPIVRAMPNLPASIGAGATVGTANTHVIAQARTHTETLLGAMGRFYWLEDESLMDSVTALSGSGPAYVFALGEAMAEAAIAQGLPEALAHALARDTVMGAGALIHAMDTLSLSTLREQVTSPGGTTEAALNVLLQPEKSGALNRLIDAAMRAARDRGRALAGG